jgi:hypothetical protein
MTDTRPGPVEAATQDLMAWLAKTGQPVRQAPPSDTGDGLTLWPLELRPQPQVHSGGPHREPFRFAVRYLLTASGPHALRLLDAVLVAAVRAGQPQFILDAGDPALWHAFGTPPRPALLVDAPVQILYLDKTAPPVLHPLQLSIIPRVTLTGRVVGPGDVPLAAMRVEVLGMPLRAETGTDGRFTIAGVPEADTVPLRLVGRGQVLTAQVDPTDADLVIKCDLPVR